METRCYESIYPDLGTVTVTFIKEIKEMGAYCSLSEFGNALGMLMMSELSRRRIRSLGKFIKMGKTEVVVVIRVNCQKGYIDLSKRRIAEGEAFSMEKKWTYTRLVNTITNQISDFKILGKENSRIRWTWPLYRYFGHAIIGFKKILINSNFFTKSLDFLPGEKSRFIGTLKKKIHKCFKKYSSTFEINSFCWAGIFIIKKILTEEAYTNNKKKIEIKLVAGSLYSVTVVENSKKKTLKTLLNFFLSISEKIKKKKGLISIKNLCFSDN